jgi:hypothetical protein
MILLIASWLKYGLFCFLLNDYLKRNYTQEYNLLLIEISYKLIYVLSKVQITYKNTYNRLDNYYKEVLLKNPTLKSFMITNDDKTIKQNIEFIYNGYVNYLTNTTEIINGKITPESLLVEFDFIIYSEYDSSTNSVNKIIINHFPTEKDFCYEKSNIKFILVEALVEDKIIKIDFYTETFNYYIENNVFTNEFLEYFIKNPRSKDGFEMKIALLNSISTVFNKIIKIF